MLRCLSDAHLLYLQMMAENLRGELTAEADVELQGQDLAVAIAHKLQMTSGGELERLRETLYPALLCAAAESGDIQRIGCLRDSVSQSRIGQDGLERKSATGEEMIRSLCALAWFADINKATERH